MKPRISANKAVSGLLPPFLPIRPASSADERRTRPSYLGSPILKEKLIPRVRTIRKLQVLTLREARVLRALAETIFPSDGTDMPSVDDAEVVEYFDDLLAHLPFKEKALIRCLIVLLEVQPLAFNGLRPKLFTRATVAERTRNLSGWETSAIFQRRLVFMAIRTLMLWAYADSQEVERGMGFQSGTRRTAERNEARLKAARRAISQAGNGGSSSGHTSSHSAAEPPASTDPSQKASRTRSTDRDISPFEEQA